MKYCRFRLDGQAHYGLVERVAGKDQVTRLLVKSPEDVGGDIENMATKRMEQRAVEEATLLAPVRPSKIVCVGRNYRAHAVELGHEIPKEPLIFFKPTSSLLDPGNAIRRPQLSQRTDFEGELAVIIGKRCHKLRADEDVRAYILGYTGLNDFTARDLQDKDGQWTRAKGFDTFCPVGPIVTDEINPWAGVEVKTRVNDAVRQQGNTRDFIFSLDVVLRYIANVMTLLPGDVIATGTPEGVGPVVAGDVVEVEVEGVGILKSPVVDE